jgi:DHA2 family multidrug resistance protein
MGYSVFQAGVVMVPRGVGTLVAMMLVGRAVGRINVRLIIGVGLLLTAFSLWQLTHLSMQLSMASVVWPGAFQGLGIGIVYVPMAALTFATLSPAMRNEGTALFNLIRNIGSSIGISTVQGLLVRNTQLVHAALAQHITPLTLAHHSLGVYAGQQAIAALDRSVTAQATMIAYLDDFQLMLILTLLALPLLLLVRSARAPDTPVQHAALE